MNRYFYDEYYKTPEVFGTPCNKLISFFRKLDSRGRIIDFGCGQGRDSIALARLGYNVTGLDYSITGIKQLMNISNKENLGIKGIVEDIYNFNDFNNYDVLLFDCFFRFFKHSRELEISLINKAIKSLSKNGIICFCIKETERRLKILKKTIDNAAAYIEIIEDASLYNKKIVDSSIKTKYRLIIIKKI